MDSHRKRSTLHRLSVVWPMNDNHEGPVPPGVGLIRSRGHVPKGGYDVPNGSNHTSAVPPAIQ